MLSKNTIGQQTVREQERVAKGLLLTTQLAELIKIAYITYLKGSHFSNPRIADKAEKIKQFAESIGTKELKGGLKLKEQFRDEMENEHSAALFDFFENYHLFSKERLEDINRQIHNIRDEEEQ